MINGHDWTKIPITCRVDNVQWCVSNKIAEKKLNKCRYAAFPVSKFPEISHSLAIYRNMIGRLMGGYPMIYRCFGQDYNRQIKPRFSGLVLIISGSVGFFKPQN